jgi:hypothetical protein
LDDAKDGPDVETLRSILAEESQVKPAQFIARMEQPAEKLYSVQVEYLGKDHGVLQFRRWSHEEASRILTLPFAGKLLSKKELSTEEQSRLDAFHLEMVLDVIKDMSRWHRTLEQNIELTANIYYLIQSISGADNQFDEQLDDFLKSNYAWLYGLTWFYTFGKTPSEVAKLPESDVKVIQGWMQTWLERVKPNVR